MSKVSVDILIVVSYNFSDSSKPCIYTNARTEALPELLSNWVQDQVGSGSDYGTPTEKDSYLIKIGYVLEDDTFCTESDTGNRGLTCGIIMSVLGGLADGKITVKSLKDQP